MPITESELKIDGGMLDTVKPDPAWLLNVGVGDWPNEASLFAARYPKCGIIGLEPRRGFNEKYGDKYPGTMMMVAAWSTSGKRTFYEHGMCSSMYEDVQKRDRPNRVQCVTVDEIWRDNMRSGKNVFLWIDTEGSEDEILKGASELLGSSSAHWVNVEVRPDGFPNRPGTCKSSEVHDVLKSHDYKLRLTWNVIEGRRVDEIWVPGRGVS